VPLAAERGGSVLGQLELALHTLAERAALVTMRVQGALEGLSGAKLAAVAASTAALAGGGAAIDQAMQADRPVSDADARAPARVATHEPSVRLAAGFSAIAGALLPSPSSRPRPRGAARRSEFAPSPTRASEFARFATPVGEFASADTGSAPAPDRPATSAPADPAAPATVADSAGPTNAPSVRPAPQQSPAEFAAP
jgi:hypothetical protein